MCVWTTGLDLLIVRMHAYNQYNCNRSFKAAYHTHVGVRMYILQYTQERIRSGRRLLEEECRHLLLPLHKTIYLKKI
jgi:hypothetical protein